MRRASVAEIQLLAPDRFDGAAGLSTTALATTGYDRTSYNGHSAKAMPGVNVRDVHGVFGGWSASDYTSTVSDAATLAYEVYGPQHRIIDAAHVAVRHSPRP